MLADQNTGEPNPVPNLRQVSGPCDCMLLSEQQKIPQDLDTRTQAGQMMQEGYSMLDGCTLLA